ncbi:fibronectin type III domain-containing protein [Sedimentisphaera salicampi]|uniref:fibronectin type III domain-containing protein n=1 Tax=Sedimentisphaera salicampi TaxID=1941349 RepID=UPI000B9C3BF2|nr:fibronectin type III domain-containing protein [Sedimentisphaera salicampi]OXU14162.1 Alpha-amylase/pullulanase [Sedimentisphaera salicampi]
MIRIGNVLFMLAAIAVSLNAETVFIDDMLSLSGWSSNTGGIGLVNYGDGNSVHMSSWWSDSNNFTHMKRDTGVIIQDEKEYELLIGAEGHQQNSSEPALGKPISVELYSINESVEDIFQTASITPLYNWPASTASFPKYSIKFDTLGEDNQDLIGKSLGVQIWGNWWNSLSIDKVELVSSGADNQLSTKLFFDTSAQGETKKLDYWGVCQGWINESNMTSAIDNMGAENIDSVRFNFSASEPLSYSGGRPVLPAGGEMQTTIQNALAQAQRVPDADLTLVAGNKYIMDDWYIRSDGKIDPVKIVDGIIAAINYVTSNYGYSTEDFDFVEVYNEPDWEFPQGSRANMYEIMQEYRTRSQLGSIPIVGPSTLSSSNAYSWYDPNRDLIDIGATHVIGGTMQSFIDFINEVHSDDKTFLNPEIHNYIELMIAAELSDRPGEGGLFWGEVDPAEGRFVKAAQGKRIAYKMHAPSWSGASAYRDLQGRVWLFLGSSERRAEKSKWEFECTNRDVFFDGEGPKREVSLNIENHAFDFIEVTWGDRSPVYFSQFVDNLSDNSRLAADFNGVHLKDDSNISDYSRWRFRPEGAFYYIDNTASLESRRDSRLSASAGSNSLSLVSNSQENDFVKWQLTQVGGSYYLENVGKQRAGENPRLKIASGAPVLTDSSDTSMQAQWSFADTGETDSEPPSSPENLSAAVEDSKITLNWDDSDEWDFSSYSVYRSRVSGSGYVEIAADLTETEFQDSTAENSRNYYYAVTAKDVFGNESPRSAEVKAASHSPLAFDDFQSNDFASGAGWNGNWQLSSSPSPVIQNCGGNYVLKLTEDASVSRAFSQRIYKPILQFDFDADSLESGEYAAGEIYDSARDAWISVWKAYYHDNGGDSIGGGNDTADNLTEVTVDLSEYAPTAQQIRFKSSVSSDEGVLFIDNVKLFSNNFGKPSGSVVYSDGMSVLSGVWNEESKSAQEAGENVGGVRVNTEGDIPFVEMNSWWDGAKYTKIYTSAGHTISEDKYYEVSVYMKSSLQEDTNAEIILSDADSSWAEITSETFNISPVQITKHTIGFSTVNGANQNSVGNALGITVSPGWWNAVSVHAVYVEEKEFFYQRDTNQDGIVNFCDFVDFSQSWQPSDKEGIKDFAGSWLYSSD